MRTSFNAGWIVKPKLNRFLELTGATSGTEPETVTLPHDAMIGTTRDPSGSHMNAYFPDGVWEYTKTFDANAMPTPTTTNALAAMIVIMRFIRHLL